MPPWVVTAAPPPKTADSTHQNLKDAETESSWLKRESSYDEIHRVITVALRELATFNFSARVPIRRLGVQFELLNLREDDMEVAAAMKEAYVLLQPELDNPGAE
jgi:hypothetical protein